MRNNAETLNTDVVTLHSERQQIEEIEFTNGNDYSRLNSHVALPSAEANDEPTFSKGFQEKIKIKDVGYAWIVLGAMFTNNVLSTGYVKSYGILYNAILDMYPKTPGVMSGVMMGLLAGCKTIFAPAAGALANVIGIRSTMCLGCSMYVAALIASFFCTSTSQLAFTLGALIGLSQCIIDTCQVVVLAQFFDSKLSLANGIRVAGNPCGGIVLPILISALLEAYGLKLTFVLLGGIMSHIFISSFLMRPIEVHIKIKVIDYINTFRDCWANDLKESGIVDLKHEYSSDASENPRKGDLYCWLLNQNTTFSNRKKKKPLDFALFKNPRYSIFLFMAAVFPLGIPLVTFYATIYAKAVVGLSTYEISMVLAFESIFDFILRISIGWINNMNLYKLSNGFLFCMCCSALGSILMPLAHNMWSLMGILALYSFGPAAFHTFINVMLCEKFGKETIATTWGFLRMVQGVFSFVHPAFIGYVLDRSGSYTLPFLLMGFGLAFCGLVIFLDCLVVRITNPNNATPS